MKRMVNWFGLAGGATILVLIVVSLYVPWWRFIVGDGLVQADTSPLNTNFNFMQGDTFTIPLIWALNVASLLSMAAGGIIMLIYSVLPDKSYSMRLLGFSYRKPLYAVVFFVASLFAITLLVKGLLGFSVPLTGSAIVQLPQSMTQNAIISVLVSAEFIWPFWLGVVAAAFCVAARVYHRWIAKAVAKNMAMAQMQTIAPPPPQNW